MSRIKNTIIGLLVVLLLPWLQGCSAVRLTYNNAPLLSWLWLDNYADFSREQTPIVKQGLERYFVWHRSTQLPGYAALLASAQGPVLEPSTPAQACRWQAQVRDQLEPAMARGLEQLSEWVPGLGEAQFKGMEKRYAKVNVEMRKDFLQPDRVLRLAESVKRARERAEGLYGALDAPQERVIKDAVAASPFSAEAWATERQRRQRDTLQTLRRLVSENADADQRLAAVRALAARIETSPDAEYRAYQVKLTDYNCAFAAQLHNATTAAQRRKARETLKGWEDDIRTLIAVE